MIDKCLYKRILDKKKELEGLPEDIKRQTMTKDFILNMLVDYIYNTLAIEGGSLTREQVRKIIMESTENV